MQIKHQSMCSNNNNSRPKNEKRGGGGGVPITRYQINHPWIPPPADDEVPNLPPLDPTLQSYSDSIASLYD